MVCSWAAVIADAGALHSGKSGLPVVLVERTSHRFGGSGQETADKHCSALRRDKLQSRNVGLRLTRRCVWRLRSPDLLLIKERLVNIFDRTAIGPVGNMQVR